MHAKYQNQLPVIPAAGGVYREGMLPASSHDLETYVQVLTQIGFIKLTESGEVRPALASAWEMTPDAMTVKITLDQRVDQAEIMSILTSQSETGYWNDATITSPEPGILEFALKRPAAGYLEEMSLPLFPYGPYQEAEGKDANLRIFSPNPRALVPPHLAKVELHIFADVRAIERAVRKGLVDGVFLSEPTTIRLPKNWQSWELTLQREQLLIFNLRNDVITADLRHRLVQGQTLEKPVDLHLAIPEIASYETLATDLKSKWQSLQANVIIEKYPVLSFAKSVIPERKYDLVLLGIDYGPDGDLFSYWHSSQIANPGRNLAGYRNKEVDRLLDEAMKTVASSDRHAKYDQARTLIETDNLYLKFESFHLMFTRSTKIKGDVPSEVLSPAEHWLNIGDWYAKEKRLSKSDSAS